MSMAHIGVFADRLVTRMTAAVKAREAAKEHGIADKRELDRIGMAAWNAVTNVIPLRPRGDAA